MKPKVSIIIPIYNVEKYLKKCLESITIQTLKEIEIILINDCSPDNSIEICNNYLAKDTRITLINNEKNLGVGLSRNLGIEVATGEYIAFVDSDDYVDSNFYKNLYEIAKEKDYDIVKGCCKKIFSEENDKERVQKNLNKKIIMGIDQKPLFMLFKYEHTTAIYKRELLVKNDVRYPDLIAGQDAVFLYYVTYYANSFKIDENNSSFYNYRVYNQSRTFNNDSHFYDSVAKCVKMRLDFLNNIDVPRQLYLSEFKQLTSILVKRYLNYINPENRELEQFYINSLLYLLSSHKHMDKEMIKDIFDRSSSDKAYDLEKYKNYIINKIKKKIRYIFTQKKS